MSDLELMAINIIVGQGMTFVTDHINKYVKSSTMRFWVSVATCTLVGLALNIDQLTWGNRSQIILSALTIWFSAQAAYKTYYEGSQFQIKIRKPVIPVVPQ